MGLEEVKLPKNLRPPDKLPSSELLIKSKVGDRPQHFGETITTNNSNSS
jgi:hypothetical protein